MNWVLVLFVLIGITAIVLIILELSGALKKPDPSKTTSIVGGQPVPGDMTVPFIVSLQNRYKQHYCAGTLVSDRAIVTAAHCVRFGPPHRIQMGSKQIGGKKAIYRTKFKVKYHPASWGGNGVNDIAVILLDSPLPAKYTPAIVNSKNESNNPGLVPRVAGWGRVSESSTKNEKFMRYIDVPIVTKQVCDIGLAPRKTNSSNICAGFAEGGKDSCQGDSGGPLFFPDTKTLIGVVSWGVGCARPNKYGVYMKVSDYRSWIDATIKELGDPNGLPLTVQADEDPTKIPMPYDEVTEEPGTDLPSEEEPSVPPGPNEPSPASSKLSDESVAGIIAAGVVGAGVVLSALTTPLSVGAGAVGAGAVGAGAVGAGAVGAGAVGAGAVGAGAAVVSSKSKRGSKRKSK